MNQYLDEQKSIRRYLLGKLSHIEQQSLEERLLTDDLSYEELVIAEDELIDEYLTETLTREEKESFENFFLLTAERQEKLRFAMALGRHISKEKDETARAVPERSPRRFWWARPFFTSPLGVAVPAVFLLALALVGWRVLLYQSDVNKGLVALNIAYRAQRPLEARITGLDYAPLPQTRGIGGGLVDEIARQHAERILLDALQEDPSPASHHALGRLYLAEQKFELSVIQFTEALKADTSNAQIHSDLGVAYMERGQVEMSDQGSGKGPEDLGHGLEEINVALELDPSLLAALYNRALCHQYMLLPQQATVDWREYLRRDDSSSWAAEARQHLKSLEERNDSSSQGETNAVETFMTAYRTGDGDAAWSVYARSRTSTGNTITEKLIDSSLQDGGDGDERGALIYLGELERQRVGDAYTSDLAKVYTLAMPHQRSALHAARALMRSGYALFAQSKITEAMESFARARAEFEAAGDTPEAQSADYATAHGAALQPDIGKGRALFARIIPACEAKNYRWLLAQSLSERAHLLLNLDNYSEAIDDSTRALGLLEEVKDRNGVLSSLVQLMSINRSFNDSERSLVFLRRGLALAQESGAAPLDTWGIYIAASLNFNVLGFYHAALDYQQEALRLALDSRRPLIISRSYEYLGLTYGNLRRYNEAVRNVHRAYEEGEALSGERNGQNMMANATLKLGDLYRLSGDQRRALEAYAESIRLYDQLNFSHYTYVAHKGKLLSYLAEGDDASASQELPVVLRLFEGYREKIMEERRRDIFFDQEQGIYDLAIDFAYSRQHDPRLAFEYSESSRARSLLDLIRHGSQEIVESGDPDLRLQHVAEPLTLHEIQEQMPEGVQILQYAVLRDKLLIWLITKSSFEARVVEMDSVRLTAVVAGGRSQATADVSADGTGDLQKLYEALVMPFEGLMDRNKLLCIVPDKELNYVPFGALFSKVSGKYLVEDFRLTVSPSSTVFINCTETAHARGGTTEERLLAVGNPTFDRRAYPQLPNLADAEHEVEHIASYYQHRRVLIRDLAQTPIVKKELEHSDVAHFAAHYVIDSRSNLFSRLLLSSTSIGKAEHVQDTGALESRDVYRMRLAHTRLVVLSACQTGIEQQYRGEGPISFARPFIVAGVPLVVASLWPVDSDATGELMIAFHRHRKSESLPTAEALRQAQLEMIASADPRYRRPSCWASFVTIGGYAEY